MTAFDYRAAFSRNIGWVTNKEQQTLQKKRLAIAGLGGVGGSHLLTLTRLGIGAFHIADFDQFEVHNFNRQAGAMLSTLGKDKAETLAAMARDINPDLSLKVFDQGVNDDNLDAFLDGVDLYVDSLDFFALKAREKVFRACYEKKIPALTAAPLGMGTAFLAFIPGKMDFDTYFDWHGRSDSEKLIRLIAGLSPAMMQRSYLKVPDAVNFAEKRGPSVAMACELCAGLMGVQVLKVLLNRGDVVAAPWGLHFDAYQQKLKKTWRPFGNKNPIQRILMALIRRQLNLE